MDHFFFLIGRWKLKSDTWSLNFVKEIWSKAEFSLQLSGVGRAISKLDFYPAPSFALVLGLGATQKNQS